MIFEDTLFSGQEVTQFFKQTNQALSVATSALLQAVIKNSSQSCYNILKLSGL